MGEKLVETRDGYTIINKLATTELSSSEVQEVYSLWAKNYEQDMSVTDSHGASIMAEEVSVFYGDRRDVRILDLASGAGLVGKVLHAKGFQTLDAIDANPDMLEEARRSGIFGHCYQEFIGPNRLPIEDSVYDCLVGSNAFVPSHLNESCFGELNRITKTGGHIFILMAECYCQNGCEYGKNISEGIFQFEAKGVWKKVQQKIKEDYFRGENGVLFIIQKLC